MMPPQRDALDDALRSVRAGRMSRRAFMQHAAALGLAAGGALGLLEACAASRHTTFLVWQSEQDNSGAYRQLVARYNQTNRDNIHVTYLEGPTDPGQLYSKYTYMLGARSGSTDVLSMDVTWSAQFAASGWLLALEAAWPASARAALLGTPFQACTYAGHIWAAPYRVDAGMIYYRTDLVAPPPTTWAQLAASAMRFASAAGLEGFLWPGRPAEGLVCQYVELLASYGGTVLDPSNPYKVAINSPAARQALVTMASWVGTASPTSVVTGSENDARTTWQAGKAVYMRNWASAHPLRSDPSAMPILGKWSATPTLASAPGGVGHPSLGGWQFGINAFSRAPHECWAFIQYMLTAASQRQMALTGGLTGTNRSVYGDPAVLAAQPFMRLAAPAFQLATARPISPAYPRITQALQTRLHQALSAQLAPEHALSMLQAELQALSARTAPIPYESTPVPTLR